MTILVGFLTVLLVLNCVFLIFLVLIQLPKKEAGLGMAFGGGAAETLFGAGSGNVLTKATKYSAGIFMSLALVLSILNTQRVRESSQSLERELQKRAAAGPLVSPIPTNVPVAPTSVPSFFLTATNAPAAPSPAATNPPPEPAK